MAKVIRMVLLFIMIYMFLFWVGFRSGEIYGRMKNKVQIEKIIIKEKPSSRLFYIVEERDYGTYKAIDLYETYDTHVLIKFLFNKKLRPLLKLKKLQIYNSKGDRIY